MYKRGIAPDSLPITDDDTSYYSLKPIPTIFILQSLILTRSNRSNRSRIIQNIKMKSAIFFALAGVALAQNLEGEPACAVSLPKPFNPYPPRLGY